MPRGKDIAWKFVEERKGDKWRCPYCGKVAHSVSRVKGHLQKTPRRGVGPCKKAPDCIGELMKWLPDQVPYPDQEDIAWKFVERQPGGDKWRCHHCKEEFFGDATAVKCHLLRGSSGGISICTEVPDTIRKLMMSLLEEGAEEEGREANVQSSTELQSHDLPSEAQAEAAEVENRGGNGQSSMDISDDTTCIWTPGDYELLQQFLRTPLAGESSSQCVLPLSPDTRRTMDEMLSKGRGRTTNYNSESSLSNSVCYNDFEPSIAQQNPHIPLPSQDPQILHSTFQHELQGSIPHAPSALDTGLSNIATTSTPQRSSQPFQSDGQCVPGAALFSPRASMDIESPIPSQPLNGLRNVEPPDSRQQIPSDIMNTMGPSTSEGMPEGAPTGASSFRFDRTAVPYSNEPLPSYNEERETETSSFHLRESMDRSSPTETHVESEANMAGLSSFQASVPLQRPRVPDQSTNLKTAHQNPTVPSSSCGADPVTRHSPRQLDMDPCIPSSSQAPNNAPPPPQIPPCGTGAIGPLSSLDMNEGAPMASHANTGDPIRHSHRVKDPFRKHVSFLSKVRWKCNFCGEVFGGGGTRIKAHLGGIAKYGIKGCEKVSADVKAEARKFMMPRKVMDLSDRGVSEERIQGNVTAALTSRSDLPNVEGGTPLQFTEASVPPQDQIIPHQSMKNKTSDAQQNTTVPSSSCNIHLVPCLPPAPLDMDPYISSSSQVPNDAPPSPHIPPSRTGRICPSSSPDMNEGAPMASHANTGDNFEENRALKRKLKNVRSRVADIRAELEFAASMSVKKHRREVGNWLPEAEKFIEDCTEAASKGCLPPQEVNKLKRKSEDLLRRGKFPKGLFEARETKVSKFLEGKMVGEAFKSNTTKILEYFVGKKVSRLGIYGMGGVGKTTIMKHIHNRLLEKVNYGNVLWITVSKDFNTHKLQDDIWKALGLDTLQETDVNKRAAMLHDRLTKRGKCTLILDDVWEHFDLEELGIPIREDGFRLALTTRSFYVCRQMRCQEIIKIEPLSPKEADSLFLEEHGSEVALSLEIKAVVKSIVEECAGLPLGVITIARSMRGVIQLFIWTDLLVKLKESSMGQTDMEKKVLMNLKFSYDCLGNPDVQQCFLSCALYPEDELIGKLELIELFIDQGLIGELETRKQQYDRGLTILSILENVCLLEDHGSKMKMHDLIRDMALHIIGATYMVKARKQLTRIPSEEYWTDALERVSLMDNCIGKFPLNMSPNCPKLSTLLLNTSLGRVNVIPDSFFQKLQGLEVLNLSRCIGLKKLPNSFSDLVNLRALLLRGCSELHHIPCVSQLTSLRKLDARGCQRLEEIEGLEMLVSLRYLDLYDTKIKILPKETFRRLLKLQYLKVWAPIKEEITYLGALETLECYFGDANDFNKCVRVIGQRNIRGYDLTVNPFNSFYWRWPERSGYHEDPIFNSDKIIAIVGWSDAIVSVGGECAGNFILIPRDMQKLTMLDCGGRTNLAGMGPLKCLEELIIQFEKDLRVLSGGQDEEGIDIRDSPATIPSPPLFPSLRRLEIYGCPKLKHLIGYGSNFPLPHLREIRIVCCDEMEGIMATVASPPPCPNPAFPSLEKIVVMRCYKMKRVVESEWLPHFPNLREIAVEDCRDMEEIIGGPPPNMTVGEIPLESLEVTDCDEMRMLLTHEWLIHLRNLKRIRVEECRGMVEMISSGAGQSQEGSTRSEAGQSQGGSIMTPVTDTSSRSSISLPKLTYLQLLYLPRLQSICEVSVTCDSIENIMVGDCPELKGIPLQLQLRDIEDLPYIWVDDEETWNMLTWDHPDAQAILLPYLRKGEEANTSGMSPTTIELPSKRKDLNWCF